MKRSINKIAALAVLAIFFTSCSDDLDSTPSIPTESPSELNFLQGEWELTSTSNSLKGRHTLKIEDGLTIHKQEDGTVFRAAYFNIINDDSGNKIVFGKEVVASKENAKVPDFFVDSRIISLDQQKLVLKSNWTYTFKKLDPVN